jgi:hypothetical protein
MSYRLRTITRDDMKGGWVGTEDGDALWLAEVLP